jgi:hypothetical protein
LKITIKTKTAQAHIEICELIRFYDSRIIKGSINQKDGYGFFLLETDEETVDLFAIVDNSLVEIFSICK